MSFDAREIKRDFPILAGTNRGKPLVYLDSAASSQKPHAVLNAMQQAYTQTYANIHRGVYELSERSTQMYDDARATVARFIGAPSADEVIFTRNATEAFNLLAYSYARAFLQPGDEMIITELEHHANFVPWLVFAKERGVVLKFWPVSAQGTLELADLERLLTPKTKLVSFAQVSNVLGCITDPAAVAQRAHAVGARVIVDGSQAVPHMPVNVRSYDCDFYIFTGHKMLGPTGIGVLYGKAALLEAMPPFLTGGDMITTVGFDGATWAAPPMRFEAGTPAIVEAIGLGAAVDYLGKLGMANVRAHEQHVIGYALERLAEVPGLNVVGTTDSARRSGVVAFETGRLHPHDLASTLDENGIAVRSGLHCAHPLHEKLGLPATTRASFYVYNDTRDVDALIEGIYKAKAYFRM